MNEELVERRSKIEEELKALEQEENVLDKEVVAKLVELFSAEAFTAIIEYIESSKLYNATRSQNVANILQGLTAIRNVVNHMGSELAPAMPTMTPPIMMPPQV